MEQLTMFDWMPTLKTEPEVGAWVKEHGAAIPHIMPGVPGRVAEDYGRHFGG